MPTPAQTVLTVPAKGSFLVKLYRKDNSGRLMLFFVLSMKNLEGKNNPLKTRRSSRGQFRQVHDVSSIPGTAEIVIPTARQTLPNDQTD
jgi:hypothetical protein